MDNKYRIGDIVNVDSPEMKGTAEIVEIESFTDGVAPLYLCHQEGFDGHRGTEQNNINNWWANESEIINLIKQGEKDEN